jgi:transcriptional regulator with GAF, ATPase, and Fis domain
MQWPNTNDTFLEYHLPGTSPSVLAVRSAIAAVNSGFNRDLIRGVRLRGESGTGKNHLARVISAHRRWLTTGANEKEVSAIQPLLQGQFAEISLQALPDTLAESELFGHRKGAFTGAASNKIGLLAAGTPDILLDEIGDASLVVQAKLLGVLESGQFRPVGASAAQVETTSSRFIFATHRSLADLVRQGKFREDLYWRTSEIVIDVPPMREQRENVPAQIKYQLAELYRLAGYDTEVVGGLREPPLVSPEDLRWATSYNWPGNLRQLRHGLIRWLALNGQIALKDAVLQSAHDEPFRINADVDDTRSLSRFVEARLEKARRERVAIAESLGDLTEQIRREVQQAVVSWHDTVRPSAAELNALFPQMQRNSVSSKLSQWRNK